MANTPKGNPVLSSQPLRVLIVDDSAVDAELMVAILKRAGYTLSFDVVDTTTALKQRLAQAAYDIILSDHNLRTWTGLDALQIVSEAKKAVPFVVVTATLGDEAAVDYIKNGATDYVLKHRLERLPVAVGRALREKAHQEEAARLQEQILLGKREWELTFDAVPSPVLLVDTDCRIRRANRAAAETLGVEFARLIGQHCYEVLHNSSEPPPDCPHYHLLHTGLEQKQDVELPRSEKTFHFTSTPLRDPRGGLQGCVLVLHDITERKRLEEQIRQIQKMEAIGRLAGGVAHDFNNLLNVIKGYAELLLRRLSPEDTLRAMLEEINKASDRAAALTRQLLAFSRQQVLEPKVLDLNASVEDMTRMLQRLIGEDVDLTTRLDPHLGHIKADPGQFEQVLLNLVVNARDAMPNGGKLTLETRNVELDESYARLHADVRPGPHVLLAVSDTGVGMDKQTLARVFEPFFTTKEKGKGTGLGMATVYGIVRQSGGHIWAYSEPGQGTTFKVYLPRVLESPQLATPAATRDALPRGSETVLVVEDEDGLRKLAREFLETCGYTVLDASDGIQALALARENNSPIQLLLTDVVLPKMGGRDLARELVALRPTLKVIFMSGYTNNAIVQNGTLGPGLAFLQKPFGLRSLATKIREVLDAH